MKRYERNISIILIVVLLNILSSCSDSGNIGDLNRFPDADIIPGIKMFNLYIGDKFITCWEKYGEPNIIGHYYSTSHGRGFVIAYWDLDLMLHITDSNENDELDINDTIYKISVFITFLADYWEGATFEGNGLGSNLESIKNEFGNCENWYDFDYKQSCEYNTLGIKWDFVDELPGICCSIWIFPRSIN